MPRRQLFRGELQRVQSKFSTIPILRSDAIDAYSAALRFSGKTLCCLLLRPASDLTALNSRQALPSEQC